MILTTLPPRQAKLRTLVLWSAVIAGLLLCFFFLQRSWTLRRTFIVFGKQQLINGLGVTLNYPLPKDTDTTMAFIDSVNSQGKLLINHSGFVIVHGNTQEQKQWAASHKYYLWSTPLHGNVIATTDNTLTVFDIRSGKEEEIVHVNSPYFGSCSWSPDSRMAACALSGSTLEIIDITKKQITAQIHMTAPLHHYQWISTTTLAVFLDITDQPNILRVSVTDKSSTPVCIVIPAFNFDGTPKEDFFSKNRDCMQTSEFSALFGSSKLPIDHLYNISQPALGRFYFYKRYGRENGIIPNKIWIEAFDRWTHTTIRIYTIESMLKRIFGDNPLLLWLFSRTPL
ncbi:MAG: hypothetical protein WCG83_05095 [Candidatus Peregrinibacteria bacterium]